MPFFDSHLATPDAVRIMGKHKPFTVFLRRMYIMAIAVILLALPTCALAATPDEYDGPTVYGGIEVQYYVRGLRTSDYIFTIPDSLSLSYEDPSKYFTCSLHWPTDLKPIESSTVPGISAVNIFVRSENNFNLVNSENSVQTIAYQMHYEDVRNGGYKEIDIERNWYDYYSAYYLTGYRPGRDYAPIDIGFKIDIDANSLSPTHDAGLYYDNLTFIAEYSGSGSPPPL